MTKPTEAKKKSAGGGRWTTPLLGAAALGTALMITAAPAAADEISDLQAENAALKSQIEALARDLQRLRDEVYQNQQAVDHFRPGKYPTQHLRPYQPHGDVCGFRRRGALVPGRQ